MSTTTATLNVNATQALQTLTKVQKQVDSVGAAFGKLRNVLGGLALGSFITQTLRFADSIQDVSNATGIATSNVLAFGQAIQENGGSFENAQNALTKLVNTIGEAAEGSGSAQNAFAKVGVTLNDLRTLSEEQIFEKSIQGLAKLNDLSLQAKTSTELFGKAIRGVDIARLAASYEEASKNAAKYSGAIATGAQVQQNLETSITNLQTALLVVLKPIGDLAKSITTNVDATVRWLSALMEIVKVIGLFLVIGRVVKILYEFVAGLIAVIRNLGAAKKAFTNLFKDIPAGNVTLSKMISKYKEIIKVMEEGNTFAFRFAVRLKKVVDAIADIGMAAGAAILGWLGITKAIEKFNEVAEQQKIDEIVNYIDELNEKSTEAWMAAQMEVEARRQVEDANKKLVNSILDVRQAYNKNANEVENAMETEIAFAMMATKTAEQIRAQQDAYINITNAIEELQKKKADLGTENKEQIGLINQEIAALYAQIPAATESARVRVETLQQIKEAQQDLIRQNELMKNQLESDLQLNQLRDQIELIGLIGDELEDNTLILEVSQNLEQQLLELRKQELDLITRKGQLTEEQFNKELAQINALRNAASERANAELDIKRQQKEKEKQLELDPAAQIKRYIDELEKGATPAKQALESVTSVFENMDNALETFVKTGKFKFKDFALSIIQDLILIQAKAAAVSVFKTLLGGIFPGLAAGGPAKAGQPYIVGEKGPELFVPNQSGTVIPNNKMGKGVASGAVNAPINNTYITNNISAVDAKSVAQLFAENRKTLLGTVRMAEKEMPYMGRA